MSDVTDGGMVDKDWTPAQHYAEAVFLLERIITSTPLEGVVKALAHALLAGVRADLDYQARERVSAPKPPEYAPYIEEDDRP